MEDNLEEDVYIDNVLNEAQRWRKMRQNRVTTNQNPPIRQLDDGKTYKINPPPEVGGKKFPVITCEYQVPNCHNEYVVYGVPEDEEKEESFVLRFSRTGPPRNIIPLD